MSEALGINGRLLTVGSPFGGVGSTTYGYDDAGREVSRTDPAVVVTIRHYNQAGRADSETIATTKASPGLATSTPPCLAKASRRRR